MHVFPYHTFHNDFIYTCTQNLSALELICPLELICTYTWGYPYPCMDHICR